MEARSERLGTYLSQQDQLLFDQFEETRAADANVGRSGTEQRLRKPRVLDRMFLDTVMDRMDSMRPFVS